MKYFFVLLLSIISAHAFAQSASTYTDFIQSDNKIKWAAEYDQIFEITPTIKKFGIKETLFKQLQNKGYIDNYSIKNDSVYKTIFHKTDIELKSDSFLTADCVYHSSYINQYATNNESPFIINEKKCSCIGSYEKNKFDIYKIKQLIYYKNAKLYIKNILVTPLCLKNTIDSNGEQKIVWEQSYSSCFNNGKNSLTPEIRKKCIDLGNAEASYDFNYDLTANNLPANVFTKKNAIFSRHLYEDILNNKVTVIGDFNKIIPGEKVINYKNDSIQVQAFTVDDTTSSPLKLILPEVNIDSFYNFTINQHFYFDTLNNILYSGISYIDVNKSIITSKGVYLGMAAWYRVYFIAPSIYKKTIHPKFLNE